MTFKSQYTPNHAAGFTLVELMIVVVIVAIGLALAVPSYNDIVERRQTTQAAEEVASFLAQARGWAVKINDEVTVSTVLDGAGNWCFGMVSGTGACNCATAPANCVVEDLTGTNDAQVVLDGFDRSTTPWTPRYQKAELDSITGTGDTTPQEFTFDPVRGIKMTDDLAVHVYNFDSDNGNWSLNVQVDPTGRVRVCYPSDSTKDVPGYAEC